MQLRHLGLAILGLAAAVAVAACSGEGPQGRPSPGGTAAPGGRGTIAYVDKDGCIARADGSTGAAVAAPFCANSRGGVGAVTWIDGQRLAFTTAEARGLGWQLVDFATGRVEVMDMQEAPRVFLIPPQYWSPRGEQVRIDSEGVATVEAEGGPVRVFPPAGGDPDATTRLVAWSPDADSLILSVSTSKELWIVERDGTKPRRLAAASRGVASWWIPHVGATPHADLTCSVIVEGSYTCLPGVRPPVLGTATADFGWSPCPGATGYEFQVLDGGGEVVFERVVAGNYLHVPLAGLPRGDLRWKMRALIGPSPAPWTEEAAFPAAAS